MDPPVKKRRALWTLKQLEAAMTAVKSGISQRQAAKQYNIPRRTLTNHIKSGKIEKILGRSKIMTEDQENDLVSRLINLAHKAIPLTPQEIRRQAYLFCEQNQITHRFDKRIKRAGRSWLKMFLSRHPNIRSIISNDSIETTNKSPVFSKTTENSIKNSQTTETNLSPEAIKRYPERSSSISSNDSGKTIVEVSIKSTNSTPSLTQPKERSPLLDVLRSTSYLSNRNMQPPVKKRRALWTLRQLEAAMAAVQNKLLSQRQAANWYKIPRRTLLNHIKSGKVQKQLGRSKILTEDQENDLAKRLIKLSSTATPLTTSEIRHQTYLFCEQNNITHNFDRRIKRAGRCWLKMFLSRHPNIQSMILKSKPMEAITPSVFIDSAEVSGPISNITVNNNFESGSSGVNKRCSRRIPNESSNCLSTTNVEDSTKIPVSPPLIQTEDYSPSSNISETTILKKNVDPPVKKRRGLWTLKQLEAAMTAVRSGISQRQAAKQYNIPRRTLMNHIKSGKIEKILGSSKVLTVGQENDLVSRLNDLALRAIPLTPQEIRRQAYLFCEQNHITHRFDKSIKRAGKRWLKMFLSRHPNIQSITLNDFKKTTNTSLVIPEILENSSLNSQVTENNLSPGLNKQCSERSSSMSSNDSAKTIVRESIKRPKLTPSLRRAKDCSPPLNVPKSTANLSNQNMEPPLNKRRGLWSLKQLEAAMTAVHDGLSQGQAAKKYNIPRRTLRNHLKSGKVQKILGRSKILTEVQENDLLLRLKDLALKAIPLTPQEIRRQAYLFCEQNNITHRFDNRKKRAGRGWLNMFLSRHPKIQSMISNIKETGNAYPVLTEFAEDSRREFHTTESNHTIQGCLTNDNPTPGPETSASVSKYYVLDKTNVEDSVKNAPSSIRTESLISSQPCRIDSNISIRRPIIDSSAGDSSVTELLYLRPMPQNFTNINSSHSKNVDDPLGEDCSHSSHFNNDISSDDSDEDIPLRRFKEKNM